MEAQQHGDQLKRGLKNRHIQLIALGGAIGTGLFLGSASVIQSAGPGIILGYAIAGFIAFLIMRQLGEMVVEEPVAGSFSHFAYKYWGSFAGFASGWNYWVLYVNAKQKCHHRCETEMSCFGSENAFDRLAIYFRAFSFPNRNHENDNFLVYNLVYKAIA